jgi:hypothetical protein
MKKDDNTVKAPDRVQKRLYSLKDAAVYLGRSVSHVRSLVYGRVIPVVMSPGEIKIFIDIKDLEDFVTKNKALYS